MVDLFSLSIRSSQILLSLFTGIGSIWSSSVPGVWEFEPYLAGVGEFKQEVSNPFFCVNLFLWEPPIWTNSKSKDGALLSAIYQWGKANVTAF